MLKTKQTKIQRELSRGSTERRGGPPLRHFEINKGTCWPRDRDVTSFLVVPVSSSAQCDLKSQSRSCKVLWGPRRQFISTVVRADFACLQQTISKALRQFLLWKPRGEGMPGIKQGETTAQCKTLSREQPPQQRVTQPQKPMVQRLPSPLLSESSSDVRLQKRATMVRLEAVLFQAICA